MLKARMTNVSRWASSSGFVRFRSLGEIRCSPDLSDFVSPRAAKCARQVSKCCRSVAGLLPVKLLIDNDVTGVTGL